MYSLVAISGITTTPKNSPKPFTNTSTQFSSFESCKTIFSIFRLSAIFPRFCCFAFVSLRSISEAQSFRLSALCLDLLCCMVITATFSIVLS